MTTFERRQRILDLLETKPGINVKHIAARLGVPESIVRSDLHALAQGRQLPRLDEDAGPAKDIGCDPAFAVQARANAAAKQLIARWAADLVQDDDTILLDASTTVYYIARFLQDRRNLTVVTNGLEVARVMGQEPTNTVILLGGVVSSDGSSVTGLLDESPLRALHINTAFVSCAGVTPQGQLAELDTREAQVKRQMVTGARTVVALIDASKFGQAQPAPFAALNEVSRIFTDYNLAPDWVARVREAGVALTICDDRKALAMNPPASIAAVAAEHYKIGFANLGDEVPFAIEVRQGLERAAREATNIDLVLADNQLSASVALSAAESLISAGVDLAIEFQIDQHVNDIIMGYFRDAGIPVIAVDIPMLGATFFGVDNYRSGQMAGVALGHWVQEHWGGQPESVVLMEEPRAGVVPAGRLRGQLEGLQSVIGPIPPTRVLHLDCSNLADVAAVRVANLLPELHASKLAFLSINDDVAIGALQALRRAGREEQAVLVGQGATRRGRAEIRRPGSRLIGATSFRAEDYGPQLLALAGKILRHEAVPPAVYVDHVFITAENVDQYYPGE